MMAIEKAKELKVKHLIETPMNLNLKVEQRWELRHEVAKKHALITIDEILSHLEEIKTTEYHFGKSIAYWRDVKDEIKKL